MARGAVALVKRDPDQCRQFLREAERLAGWRSGTLESMCDERLVKGAEEYGEDQFLTADCVWEAMEEAADGAGGWVTLQHQKCIINDDLEYSQLLLGAAAHFVHAFRILDTYRELKGR